MIRKRRLLACAALAAALALGACGSPNAGTGGTGDNAPSGATGAPVPGGNARILMLQDPNSMDPAVLGNAYAVAAVLGNSLYGELMTNDPTTGQVQFKMAQSFTTTDGGTTFELKLRPGLVFSDGSPLDATAVKVNWDRIKDPATGSAARGDAAMVASTAVVDPTTLKATLVTPIPSYAQSVLGSSMNWIASPAALAGGKQAFDANPIGAGPFTLKSWTRQAAIELVKNPRYWDAPKPYLDSVTLRASLDAGQRVNSVISGGADVSVESDWATLAKATSSGLPTTVMPVSGGIYMALNSRRAPFDDVRARQAVAAALDMDALNLAVYSGKGKTADKLFDQSSPFFSDTPLRKPDKATAQRLFDELAAEGKPVSFSFSAFATSENRALAEAVQAQLATFKNVTMQVKVIDLSQANVLFGTHDFDTVISSAFFTDPDPRLYTVFNSGSASNMSGVGDPVLDQALLQGRTATSVDQRKAAYATVQQRVTDLVPVIFITRSAPSVMTSKKVGGVVQYGLGSLQPEELWIQK
jgi:peptide/nickel transport system substrate-binding protein